LSTFLTVDLLTGSFQAEKYELELNLGSFKQRVTNLETRLKGSQASDG